MEESTGTLWSKADHGGINELEQERQWSELPYDLLDLILSYHLFAGDRFAFLAVCRSWRQSVVSHVIARPRLAFLTFPPQPLNQTPCLINLPRKKLFHPILNASFNLDDHIGSLRSMPKASTQSLEPAQAKLATRRLEEQPEKGKAVEAGLLSDAVIRASKYDWLLMTRGERRIFFFNPFTQMTVDLPDYNTGSSNGMTFSSPPTSSNCVVVGLEHIRDIITLYKVKVGEDRWTEIGVNVNNIPDFNFSYCNPVTSRRCHYYLGMLGELFIYDVDKNECSWTPSSKAIRELLLSDPSCERYMMEDDDGNLLAVFMACDGRWIQVYKYLLNKGGWQAVNQLKNKALYVSHPGSFCEASPLRGTSNKVYFPRFRDNNSLFYSLATKKYHTFNGGSYDNFLNSKMPLYTTWIKFGCDQTH